MNFYGKRAPYTPHQAFHTVSALTNFTEEGMVDIKQLCVMKIFSGKFAKILSYLVNFPAFLRLLDFS